MDLNVTLRVPGLEKLIEVLTDVAGPLLAPPLTRRETKAKLIRAEGDAQVLGAEAEAVVQAMSQFQTPEASIESDIDFRGQQIAARVWHREQTRQLNIEDVVERAAENLEGKEVPDVEPDHDWVGRFFGDVQDVSSAEMKELYGRMLAGQIERPGSFSLLSMNVLRNLDPNAARLYRTLCSACITAIPDGKTVMDCRVPVLNGTAGTNALSRYGLSFGQLNVLNEHGLIHFRLQLLAGLSVRHSANGG